MRTFAYALLAFILVCVGWARALAQEPRSGAPWERRASPSFPRREVVGLSAPLAGAAQNVELVGQVGGFTSGVAVSGQYAYVGIGPRLVILNISDPRTPRLVGQSDLLPGVVRDVAVSGGYAYVAADEAGLRVIAVSDPAYPNEVGFYDTPGSAWGVAVSGGYAYVADWDAGLLILRYTGSALPTPFDLYLPLLVGR